MSTRAGAIAVIIALGLIALAIILLRSGSSPPAVQSPTAAPPALAITGDEVSALAISWKSETHSLMRDDRGGWSIGLSGGSWPIDPQPVDTLLRLLTSLTADDSVKGQSPPAPADRLDIRVTTTAAAAPATLSFSGAPVAGRVLALRDGAPFGMADARILELCTRPGPLEWRSLMLIPDRDARGAARLAITTASGDSIELARLDGVWRMRRPMSARANPEAVAALLDRLASTRISEFLSPAGAPSLQMGRAGASRTIELAWDQRSARPDGSLATTTITRRIVFGEPGSANTRDRVRASVDGPARLDVALGAEVPLAISTAPRNYLADTATTVLPADVGFLRLRTADGAERGFRREGSAWTVMPTGAPADAAPIDALLRFLGEQTGEPQESFAEADIRSLVRIELLDFETGPLEFLDAGYTADGALAIRSGSVVWLYARLDAPDLLAMPAFDALPPVPQIERTPVPDSTDAK